MMPGAAGHFLCGERERKRAAMRKRVAMRKRAAMHVYAQVSTRICKMVVLRGEMNSLRRVISTHGETNLPFRGEFQIK